MRRRSRRRRRRQGGWEEWEWEWRGARAFRIWGREGEGVIIRRRRPWPVAWVGLRVEEGGEDRHQQQQQQPTLSRH